MVKTKDWLKIRTMQSTGSGNFDELSSRMIHPFLPFREMGGEKIFGKQDPSLGYLNFLHIKRKEVMKERDRDFCMKRVGVRVYLFARQFYGQMRVKRDRGREWKLVCELDWEHECKWLLERQKSKIDKGKHDEWSKKERERERER